jgi:hypothetical protein
VIMAKPTNAREAEGQEEAGRPAAPNAPKKTDTNNPERNPRDQRGRGGSK